MLVPSTMQGIGLTALYLLYFSLTFLLAAFLQVCRCATGSDRQILRFAAITLRGSANLVVWPVACTR